MSTSDEKRVKQICASAEKLLHQTDKDGYPIEMRLLPADDQAEVRRTGQRLFPLLKRIADDKDRAKARAKDERQGT